MVDLWENLVEKAYFTVKNTGPAGQFWQMESALRHLWKSSKSTMAVWKKDDAFLLRYNVIIGT